MKKYIVSAGVALVSLALVWSAFAQPAGNNTAGGNRRGGAGMERAGGMRRGQMGRARQRPSREERLADIKTLEKQIAALKAIVEKAPATDPNIANLQGDASTKFMAQYTEESNAINGIQQTLSSMRGVSGGRGGFRFGGPSEDVLSELRVLAQQEKAPKTVARLDVLIKEEQTRAARRGSRGQNRQGGQGGQRRNQQQ